jgi:hypothetical protein
VAGEFLERDADAIDRHRGLASRSIPARRAHSSAHHLPDRDLFFFFQHRSIALEYLNGDFFHLLERKATIDARVTERPEEPRCMISQTKRLVSKGSGDIVNAVSGVETGIEHGDLRFVLGHERTVQVNDLFSHDLPPFGSADDRFDSYQSPVATANRQVR